MGVVLACSCVSVATAEDAIRLENGDTLRGVIVKITGDKVEFESKILGKLTLDRKRVSGIVFDAFQPENKPAATQPAGSQPANRKPADNGKAPAPSVQKLLRDLAPEKFGPRELKELERGAKRNKTPEGAVEELRKNGIAPGTREALQAAMPGFAVPEVQDYFNDRVDGLKSGDLDISDIRKDAENAVEQLEDLKKDLGPSGAALDGYLSILKGFIEKTKPGPAPMPSSGK